MVWCGGVLCAVKRVECPIELWKPNNITSDSGKNESTLSFFNQGVSIVSCSVAADMKHGRVMQSLPTNQN